MRNVLRGFAVNNFGVKPDNESVFAGAIPLKRVAALLATVRPVKRPAVTSLDIDVVSSDAHDGESHTVEIVDRSKCAVVDSTTGQIYGWHGANFEPHDYNEWGVKLTSAIAQGTLKCSLAALFDNGGKALLSFQTPDTVTNPYGFDFSPNLVFMSSLDGTIASTHALMEYVHICQNMAGSIRHADKKDLRRHTKYSNTRERNMDETRANLALDSYVAARQAEIKELAETPISDAALSKFLDLYIPIPADVTNKRGITVAENRRDALLTEYRTGTRSAQWTGTLLGLIQADNTYRQHDAVMRGGDRDATAWRFEQTTLAAVTGRTVNNDRNVLALAERALASV